MTTDTSALVEQRTRYNRSQQMVLDVLIAAHRNNLGPITAGQIRERLEMIHSPRRFDKGWVTGRLDELRDKGAAENGPERRMNPLTRKRSSTWQVPLTQARVCA